MAESLGTRVRRIVSGSFHALVSAVEDMAPEAVMEQAIREVDDVCDEIRHELGRELANKHLATKRLAEENRKHDDLAAKIELALSEKRDDLAEAAIAKQLDVEAQIPLLEQAITECGERQKELEGFLTALQARRREMEEELRLYRETRAAEKAASGAAKADSKTNHEAKVRNAERAFDRVMEKQTSISRAASGLTSAEAQKLQELDKLARENRIKERLAMAKAGRGDK